jgi:hypothetical protein
MDTNKPSLFENLVDKTSEIWNQPYQMIDYKQVLYEFTKPITFISKWFK